MFSFHSRNVVINAFVFFPSNAVQQGLAFLTLCWCNSVVFNVVHLEFIVVY